MSFMGGMGVGTGPGSGLRFASTRGRTTGGSGMQGVNYPSPFFDVAHTYLPATVKQLFRWCRYYFLTGPLVNSVVFKLSEYPITDLIFDHKDPEVRNKWSEFFQENLRYRAFQTEVGLDYYTYGNSVLSMGFPFIKYLYCQSCEFHEQARRIRNNWVFTNFQFRLHCPKCNAIGDSVAKDQYVKNASGIKLIRWNVEDLEIQYNDITAESTYFYTIPSVIRNDTMIGRKDIVEAVPQIFIQALKEQKGIIFSKDNLFHLKRPSLAHQDRGWGIPLLLPVLKDMFYLQIMKKAQECVAPETLLETSKGLIPASEVRVGDFVRTHLGSFKPISGRAERPMLSERGDYAVQVTLTSMRQLSSTFSNNHPLWVLRRNEANRRVDTKEHRLSSYVLRNPDLYKFDWVDAGDLNIGDYVGYPTSRIKERTSVDIAKYTDFTKTDNFVYSGVSLQTAEAFEALENGDRVEHNNAGKVAKRKIAAGKTPKRLERHIELDEDLAYIAGWYLGDGSIGARRIDFSMGPNDTGIELQEAIGRVFGGSFAAYANEKSDGWILCAFETIFSEFMKGWISGHAADKRIPEEILCSPDNVVLAFFRGYLEADGYSTNAIRNDERVSVCCANKQLCYQLWSLLLTFGCISTLSERTSYNTVIRKKDGSEQFLEGGRPVFSWSVTSKSARRLLALMEGTESEVVTSGKSGFFVHGYFATRIQNVEIVPCEKVISLEVLDNHTFCVPGMATHNSILLEHIVPLRVLFPQAGSGTSDPYCVSPSTLIETPYGLLPASEIKEGDFLRSHTGAWRSVEGVLSRPVEPNEAVYRVGVSSLSAFPFEVSEEHPLLGVRKTNHRGRQLWTTPNFIPVKELSVGDYVAYPSQRTKSSLSYIDLADYTSRSCTPLFIYRRLSQQAAIIYEWLEENQDPKFPWGERKKFLESRGWTEDNYAIAYTMRCEGHVDRMSRVIPLDKNLATLVGYYLAEGSNKSGVPVFSLGDDEQWIADEIEAAATSLGFRNTSRYLRPEQHSLSLEVQDVLLGEFLTELCGHGFAAKRIPQELSEAPDTVVVGMLRALFAGDGCSFKTTTNRVALKLANPHIILEARRLLLSFGLIGCTTKETFGPDAISIAAAYQLSYNGEQAEAIRLLFSGGVIDRIDYHSRCGLFREGYVLLRIDEIKVVSDVLSVIGFQMAEDKSFCVAGVATHNTTVNLVDWREQVASEIARWRLDNQYIPILPLPIGNQTIGGDGKALLMVPEIQAYSEQIINGMQVPLEFIKGGLCLSPSSLVFTNRGLERLDEIASQEESRIVPTHKKVARVSQVHLSGRHKITNIKTRSGLVLNGSDRHGLLQLQKDLSQEFVAIKDLQVGAYVAVRVGANLWPSITPTLKTIPTKIGPRFHKNSLAELKVPSEVTPEFARLLGYLVSEGSCSEASRLGFANIDKELADDFANCAKEVFGLSLKPSISNYVSVRGPRTKYALEISRQYIVEFIQALGVNTDSYGKTVPLCIRTAPKHIVVAFLRAYFDGDGGFSTCHQKASASAHSVSHRLLQEVQLLLLNMGIVGTIYPPYGTKTTYTLQIHSHFALKYLNEIGFTCHRKAAEALAEIHARRPGNLSEKVPYLRGLLKEVKDRHVHGMGSWKFESVQVDLAQEQYTTKEVAHLLKRDLSSVCNYINSGKLKATFIGGEKGQFGSWSIAKSDLNTFLEVRGVAHRYPFAIRQYEYNYENLDRTDFTSLQRLEPDLYARIKTIQEDHFFWDQIVSIEELPVEEEMLDLGVEDTHSFQANGFLCHNSYAGTNVSMRMLENQFIGYVLRHKALVKYVMKQTAAYTGWPEVNIRFKPFKMADDIQRKAYLFQLNQANKISDTTLLQDADLDQEEENGIMLRETDTRIVATKKQQLSMAEIQGEAQLIMSKFQVKAQQAQQKAMMTGPAPGEPGGPEGQGMVGMAPGTPGGQEGGASGMPADLQQGPNAAVQADKSAPDFLQGVSSNLSANQNTTNGPQVDITLVAKNEAQRLSSLNPDMQRMALQNMRMQSPELADLVQQMLSSLQAEKETGGPQVDMRPLPEQRSPRRNTPMV